MSSFQTEAVAPGAPAVDTPVEQAPVVAPVQTAPIGSVVGSADKYNFQQPAPVAPDPQQPTLDNPFPADISPEAGAPAQPVTAEQQQAQQGTTQQQIAEFAEAHGIDPLQLGAQTLEEAQNTLSFFVDQIATEGLQAQSAVLPDATPQIEIPASPEIDLGEDADEKTLAVLNAFKAQNDALVARLQKSEEQFVNLQQYQQQDARNQRQQTALKILDGLKDNRFGTSKSRNMPQNYAVQQVFNIADAIVSGYANRGLQAPALEQVLNLAVLQIGKVLPPHPAQATGGAPATVQQNQLSTAVTPAAPAVTPVQPIQPLVPRADTVAQPQAAPPGQLAHDAGFRQKARQILGRR